MDLINADDDVVFVVFINFCLDFLEATKALVILIL
jgi:hypothetical protein